MTTPAKTKKVRNYKPVAEEKKLKPEQIKIISEKLQKAQDMIRELARYMRVDCEMKIDQDRDAVWAAILLTRNWPKFDAEEYAERTGYHPKEVKDGDKLDGSGVHPEHPKFGDKPQKATPKSYYR